MSFYVRFRPWGSFARFEVQRCRTSKERDEFIREHMPEFECIGKEWATASTSSADTASRRSSGHPKK